MRMARLAFVVLVLSMLFGLAAPAQAARPCNEHPTLIQPITCRILEKL